MQQNNTYQYFHAHRGVVPRVSVFSREVGGVRWLPQGISAQEEQHWVAS